MKKVAGVTLAILLVIAALIYINSQSYNQAIKVNGGSKNVKILGSLSAVSESNSGMICWEDMMLETQGAQIHARSVNGKIVWGLKLAAPVYKIVTAASNIAILDESKELYYFSKQGKLLWQYTVSLDVADIFSDDNGMILIEYAKDKGSYLDILNTKGARIANLILENATVLSFASNQSKNFSISAMDITGETVKDRIITYNAKGEIVWAEDFENQILPIVKYNNDGLLVVGEDKLMLYKLNGKKTSEIDFKTHLLNVNISKNATASSVLFMDKGKMVCSSFDSKLKKQANMILDKAYQGAYVNTNRLIIYDRDTLQIFDLKGSLISTYKKTSDISSVYTMDDNTICIVSNRKLEMLTLE